MRTALPALALAFALALVGCTAKAPSESRRFDCPEYQIEPGAVMLVGVVEEEVGKPVDNVAVRASGPGYAGEGTSDGRGCFVVVVSPGEWNVTFSKSGFKTTIRQLDQPSANVEVQWFVRMYRE